MAPAVRPGAQMRRPRPAVDRKRGRHLGDGEPVERGAHHHLAGELHAGGPQVQREDGVAAQAAQAAMEIADAGAEEHPPDQAEHGIAEIAVQERHGAGRDAAGKAVAHHEVGAFAQLGEKQLEAGEIVAVVGVAHDDEAAARRGDPGPQRRAVAALGHRDDAGAARQRIFHRAVARAVVRDQDFAGDAGAGEEAMRLVDAGGDGLGLVEARHQDGELDVAACSLRDGRLDGVRRQCPGHERSRGQSEGN